MGLPYKESFWLDNDISVLPPLVGDAEADVVVVGGGVAGLSSAYFLKKAAPGLDIALLERRYAGSGASGRNAGALSPPYREWTRELVEQAGEQAARLCVSYYREAMEFVEAVSAGQAIPELERVDFMRAAFNDESWKDLQETAAYMETIGVPFRLLDAEEMQDQIAVPMKGGRLTGDQGVCNPFRWSQGFRRAVAGQGVRVYENTPVTHIELGNPVVLTTRDGWVRTPVIVLATNGFSEGFPFAKDFQTPTYTRAIATEVLTADQEDSLSWGRYQVVTAYEGGFWARYMPHRKQFIFGGSRLLGADPDAGIANFGGPGERMPLHEFDALYEGLFEYMVRLFPGLAGVTLDAAWGGPTSSTASGWPHIGPLPGHPNVILNLGHNARGLLHGSYSGRMIQGLALGRRYEDDVAEKVRRVITAIEPIAGSYR
ncbi:MAG: hypothetical protein BZY88_12810 [SAR202 cluster bacterium Io17-Chloro-G9]|nr:MAG: hypothetical protein BZY88_12810 [SAR202 cluster bacterium Io17-Chloro-G9]